MSLEQTTVLYTDSQGKQGTIQLYHKAEDRRALYMLLTTSCSLSCKSQPLDSALESLKTASESESRQGDVFMSRIYTDRVKLIEDVYLEGWRNLALFEIVAIRGKIHSGESPWIKSFCMFLTENDSDEFASVMDVYMEWRSLQQESDSSKDFGGQSDRQDGV